MKDLAGDAEQVQTAFEQQLQRLQEQAQQLSGPNGLKPGTPDYQHLEESLVSQKAVIQGQIQMKRKEFVQKEAHLYFNAYKEISDEVKYFCEQRGISLVLNFNGDNISEGNPDEVARGISNKVVFFAKNLDITPYVLQRFIQDPRAAQGPAGPGAYTPR